MTNIITRKRRVSKEVNRCFTPSQPAWLYQGERKRRRKKVNRKKRQGKKKEREERKSPEQMCDAKHSYY